MKLNYLYLDKNSGKACSPLEIIKLIYSNTNNLNRHEQLILLMRLLNCVSYKNTELDREIHHAINDFTSNDSESKFVRSITSSETSKVRQNKLDINLRCFKNFSRGVWGLTDYGYWVSELLLTRLNIETYNKA